MYVCEDETAGCCGVMDGRLWSLDLYGCCKDTTEIPDIFIFRTRVPTEFVSESLSRSLQIGLDRLYSLPGTCNVPW